MSFEWIKTLGWQPSSEQRQKFDQFYELLLAANQSLNLTRIISREEFWEKHLWDSLSGIMPWLNPEMRAPWVRSLISTSCSTVIDIGTGGGFPGIPAAIACPDWQVSLLDSTQKKIESLSRILQALHCTSVRPICDRAEQLGHLPLHRAQYDLALIRAVASAPVCAEYAMPLIREQGIAVLYRGHWTCAEEVSLQQALSHLGAELCHVQSFTTPTSKSDRHCLYLKKTTPTPEKYPRRIGVPTKKPLG